MKKTILIFSLIFIFGCQKFLDEPIRGVQTVDNYFQTKEECQNFLTGCYKGMFQNDWWMIQFFYVLTETATDDAWLSNPTQAELDYKDFSRFQVTAANDYLYPFWEYMYKNIFQSNLAIQSFTDSPVNQEDPEFITQLIAEARFIRAFSYFELAKNFKEMPLITATLSPEELLAVQLSSQEEIYIQIASDFEFAANHLPDVYSPNDYGRATKGASWAFLSKAYLYNEKWDLAKSYADSVINSGLYALEPEFGNIWYINNRNGIESIFEVQTNFDANYDNGNSLPILTGGREDHGWYYAAPSSNLENAFLELSDTIRLRATIIKGYNEATAEAEDIGKARVYDTDGSTIAVQSFNVSRLRDSKSMRINRKFYIVPEDRISDYGHGTRNKIPKNHIVLRLAELKLIRAEAMWHLIHTDGNASFSEGDIINGDLHDIRSRVNLPDIFSTGDQLLLDIYHEKRLELAGELRRWDEIRRAKHPSDGTPMVNHIMGPGGSFVNYNTQQNVDWWETQSPYANREPNDKGINYSLGREWLPIPAHDAGYLK